MIATKEQERKALGQIRKIIADLGENSYLATAFEGCFEDAEENIENDCALTMKYRYETERERVEQLADKLSEETNAHIDYKGTAEKRYNDLKEKWAKAERKIIDDDNMNTIMLLLAEKKEQLDRDMKINGDFILAHLGQPDSDDYKEAVADYQNDKELVSKIDCAYKECCRALRA